MNFTQSACLYIGIYIISFLFARASQRIVKNPGEGYYDSNVKDFKSIPFLLSFFIPWVFVSFTNIGVDYKNYYNIIHGLNWQNFYLSHYNEAGMNLVFLLFRDFFHGNIDASLFAVKTLTIMLIAVGCFILRNEIKMEVAIAAYLMIFYLPSFYLISLCFAASILYLAFAIYLLYDKRFIPVVLILVAAQMHNTCYLMIPVFFACEFLKKGANYSKPKKVLLVVAYIIAIALSSTVFNMAIRLIPSFHYNAYATRDASGTGLYFFVLYVPLAYIVYKLNSNSSNVKINNCLFVLALTSCLINILSYRFRVIERIELLLLPMFLYCIPYDVLNTNILFSKGKKTRTTIIAIIVVAYYLLRAYLVFRERVTLASGLANYSMFNPFLQ